jgi:hypothetical protein
MAHVRSTTHPRDDDTVAEGEGATDRTKLIQASDTDSHSRAGGDCDEGSHSWSYYFRPLMITIRRRLPFLELLFQAFDDNYQSYQGDDQS